MRNKNNKTNKKIKTHNKINNKSKLIIHIFLITVYIEERFLLVYLDHFLYKLYIYSFYLKFQNRNKNINFKNILL